MDRLAELRRTSHTGGGTQGAAVVEMMPPAAQPVGDGGDPLEHCFRIVADVQNGNRQIAAKTDELRARSVEQVRSFDLDNGAAANDGVQAIMDAVVHIGKSVKGKLDELQAQTKKLSETEELAQANAATVKIHENQHAHLTRSFLKAMAEYRAATKDNEQQLRDQTVRRIKLKYTNDDGTTVSEDQAMQMAEQVLDLGVEDALFQQSKDTLASILETRQDLLRIERSMRELHQIVNDLAVLVNEQTELMDQIHTNVQTSVKYVEKGREELKQAKKYGKKARKKLCWIVMCVACVVGIVGAIVLGFTVPSFG